MSLPVHRFFLLSGGGYWEEGWAYDEFKRRILLRLRREKAVELPMELYEYIADTLEWIPSVNPADPRPWPGRGLNQFGPTLITTDGAGTFEHVFKSWADLFAGGPELVRLRGNLRLVRAGEFLQSMGESEIYEFDRDALVPVLRALASYGAEVGSGESVIVHLGI
jgi:hypothetical protein